MGVIGNEIMDERVDVDSWQAGQMAGRIDGCKWMYEPLQR